MGTRIRNALDGIWQFWPDPDGEYNPGSLPEALARPMPVPAAWQSQAEFRHFNGPAWYRRSFDLDAAIPAGQSLWLHFGAVDDEVIIWVNGQVAGQHSGGYLPFEINISQLIQPGQNWLTLRVTDDPEKFDEIPHGKQSWYGMLSGIWQPVWLEQRPQVHIQNLRITAQAQQVEVLAALYGALPAGSRLEYKLLGPQGQPILMDYAETLNFQFKVDDPARWDPGQPNLYQLQVRLLDAGGRLLDESKGWFGFRSIETRDGQLLLNGHPLYLRAALDQDYYPDGFCTPPSVEFLEAEIRKALAMGLNCLRVHIKVADPGYYEAADRLGILIWTELPNWNTLTESARRRARQTLAGMVERDWNHPSIIIWTIINESWGIDLSDPDQRAWLAQMVAGLKSLDPHRLVVDNSACWGNFHIVTDLEDFHNYYAMPDHADQWQTWVEKLAGRPGWSFAHKYTDANNWREFLRDPWQNRSLEVAAEVHRTGQEPLLVSEFGNWGLPDVEKLHTGYGAEPWWFETGQSWGDGVVYPHGVQSRFEEYHLNRAFTNLCELTQTSQQLQFAALQYQIGQMRRQAALQGYVITEFSDVHWESNGLLDMLRNPKVYFNDLGWLNADDFIGLDLLQACGRSGETCRASFWLSHYSRTDVAGSRVTWRLSAAPGGELGVPDLATSGVWLDGEIQLVLPTVNRPERLTLLVNWLARDDRLLAHNQLNILVFPASPALPAHGIWVEPELQPAFQAAGFRLAGDATQSPILVTRRLGDAQRQDLLAGKKILWLAEEPDSYGTHIPNLGLKKRAGSPWQGDWASSLSWLNRDRTFRDLPGPGVLDFSFRGLTAETILTGFSTRDFARQVQAGLFVGWLHKPVPIIAGRKVGRGHLLACSLRLSQNLPHNPLAVYLLSQMLGYLPA